MRRRRCSARTSADLAPWIDEYDAAIHHGDRAIGRLLDSLARRTGERIDPGGEVGRVGTSGGRDTPALYFEIRQGGNPIDPGAWLTRR